jgi:hypothetical protein
MMRDPRAPDVRRDGVQGVMAGNGVGKALRRSRPDRTCEQPGCGTVLSIYNDADRCWQHTPIRPYFLQAPRRRRRIDSAA